MSKVEINSKDFELELAKYISDNCEDIAKQVAIDARAGVKVITGALRKSIKAKKSKFEDGGAIVIATAPHAKLVEFGHGGQNPAPPHPFLRKALDKNIELARQKFGAK
jgi:HK97 gp10 family phage protein